MEELYEQVLRLGTFSLAIAVYIATFFTKRVAQIIKPSWTAKKQNSGDGTEVVRTKTYSSKPAMWWNEVILPAIPVSYGMAMGLFPNEFLFGVVNESLGGRLMFAAGIGWFTTFFYKMFRKVLLKKTGVDIDPSKPADIPPEVAD